MIPIPRPAMIPVTQYLLPDGKKRQLEIERPANIEQKACAMIDAGLTFEVEILRTGEVSLTYTDGESDLGIRVVRNNLVCTSAAFDELVEDYKCQ